MRWRDLTPVLDERTRASTIDPHYLYQSVWASSRVKDTAPAEHVDIGSQIQYVVGLGSFAAVTFIDIRPPELSVPNILVRHGDITALPLQSDSVFSMSCLHVLEHVGLGRYGDSLDPAGDERGASELVRTLAPGGRLLLSVPVGLERVCFNAHRIYAPATILRMFGALNLVEFSCITDAGKLVSPASLELAGRSRYACGLFEFVKQAA